MPSISQPDLYIIGLGVSIPGHVTVQATRAMSRCVRLYSIVQEPPRWWLPKEHLNLEVINALKMYNEDSIRTQNYERAARTIIEALGTVRPIGYVTYGNPMSYDRVAQNLVEYTKASDITMQVVPGISSFDTMLCDLTVDMAPAIQVFDASWLVACHIEPNIYMPALVMQVSVFGSFRTHYSRRPEGRSLAGLVEYLCRFYPPSHSVSLVRSTGQEGDPANVRTVALGTLSEVTSEDLSGASLYIPVLRYPKPDQELFDAMERM